MNNTNNNQCCESNKGNTGSGFVFIIVLYILLAIILESWVRY